MIQCETADECIKKIKKSLTDGADAFGIQLCVLKREYRDEETLKRIFSACGDKPIYATSYRCKQKELIDKIHSLGGEVLMSSHTFKSTTLEENLMIAKAHIERGADVIKIVNNALSEDEIPKYIDIIQKITAMTDKKLLFLVSGKGQIIRYIGPSFGVCMYLCVQEHGELDTPEQPVLKKLKAVRDNILF